MGSDMGSWTPLLAVPGGARSWPDLEKLEILFQIVVKSTKVSGLTKVELLCQIVSKNTMVPDMCIGTPFGCPWKGPAWPDAENWRS